TTAASDAHPARDPLPGSTPVIGHDIPTAPIAAGCRAGEGLPSSRRHHLNVPRPLRRGVPRGCASRLFTPFHGLRRERRDSALPSSRPHAGTLAARQASLHATDRSVAPPTGLLTLGFDPARFQTEPPA